MFGKIKNNQILKSIIDPKNLGLYVLAIVALSVTWSTIKVIEKNYELEKQITVLRQQVDVLGQQTQNQQLKNKYYQTDAYLDLAVRKYFGKAISGEKMILVPSDVMAKYIHPEATTASSQKAKNQNPRFIQNLQAWINFFLHRPAQ